MLHPLKLTAIGLAALVLAACSGTSSTTPGPLQRGGVSPFSAMRHSVDAVAGLDMTNVHIMRTLGNDPGPIPNAGLTYHGGPVEYHSHIYVVFWGFNKAGSDPSKELKYMTAFLNGVGGSKWMNIDHQYYQIVGGKKQFIINSISQLEGTWVDKSTVPSSPTDAQVQAEASRLENHVGYDKDGSYVVATPHNHNTAGFGSSFCAYHGATNSSGGVISYSNIPYMTDAGANCGQNFVNGGSKGLLDGVSIVEGHELAESQTDPQPPTGWTDSGGGEIGDLCAWLKPPAGDIKLSTGTFAVQGLWDNKKNACEISGP
jgi:serine protease